MGGEKARRHRPAARAVTPQELGWVAALLEGEGSFGQTHHGRHAFPKVTIGMTDEDVIQRFCTLTGAQYSAQQPSDRRKDGGPRKRSYDVNCSGTRAVEIMRAILPLMGARRSERILGILADYYETRMHVCLHCGREFFHHSVRAGLCSQECTRARRPARLASAPARG